MDSPRRNTQNSGQQSLIVLQRRPAGSALIMTRAKAIDARQRGLGRE
jgi:hypothetical protein